MVIPTSMQQLLITLVLVLPGFVYQEVRVRFRGRLPSDIELTSRLLRALATSTMFALVYIALATYWLADYPEARAWALIHPAGSAVIAFVAAFAAPAVVASLPELLGVRRRITQLQQNVAWWPSWRSTWDPRPSGWDVAFQTTARGFVRVKTKDGTWYAGYFGDNSYASSFPDSPSLYLERSYAVDANGAIGQPINNSRGAVINCSDVELVELLAPAEDSDAGHNQDEDRSLQ